jgi:ABC-type lipoprotein export system ATPase subunit
MGGLIRVDGLRRVYTSSGVAHTALDGVSLEVERGEFVAIMGHSGSGKSTLLNLIGTLDRPDAGSIEVGGQIVSRLDEAAKARFRRAHIGFVFQSFQLIDNLTVLGNVELPALLLGGMSRRAVRERACCLLARLGIADQESKYPWELSGGQQQRVAIARALVNRPTVLLADEPTGNLDSASGGEVLSLLSELNGEGQTILMVTHDALAASRANRVVFLHDGRVVGSMPGGRPGQIAQHVTLLH